MRTGKALREDGHRVRVKAWSRTSDENLQQFNRESSADDRQRQWPDELSVAKAGRDYSGDREWNKNGRAAQVRECDQGADAVCVGSSPGHKVPYQCNVWTEGRTADHAARHEDHKGNQRDNIGRSKRSKIEHGFVKLSFTSCVYAQSMDESSTTQNRRQRRSNVLMAAALEFAGMSMPVKLRNLSSDGALVEGEKLPVEGADITFKRQELSLTAKVIWVRGSRAGISFKDPLSPEAVLRHVPTPRPRVLPDFRRPGLAAQPLSPGERRAALHLLTPSNS